jgi:hypothetical protein
MSISIYFPENVYYKLGFKPSRRWSTLLKTSPSGRTQRRPLFTRPKRQFTATIYPTTMIGPLVSVPPNPTTTDDIIFGAVVKPFLDSIQGQLNPFYIFTPQRRFLYQLLMVGPFTLPGDLPISFPFRGGFTGPWSTPTDPTVLLPDVQILTFNPGALSATSTDFTVTSGLGRETLLTAVDNTVIPDGTYDSITINVNGAQERIPAVMTSDIDSFDLDWTAAEPPSELNIDIEEYFG